MGLICWKVNPKVEGRPRFPRRLGATRKEFVTKVVGLETHTFDIGNSKYASKYQKSVDAIAYNRSTREGPRLQRQSRN